MAQTAKTDEAGKASDNITELGKRTADKGVDVASEAVDRTADTARRSAEGAAEVSQALAELAREQARHNVEAFQALTRTVNWEEVARIQSDLLRATLEWATEFTRRYFETVQAVVTSTASATRDQARKAA
jgi:hypothetical protein